MAQVHNEWYGKVQVLVTGCHHPIDSYEKIPSK